MLRSIDPPPCECNPRVVPFSVLRYITPEYPPPSKASISYSFEVCFFLAHFLPLSQLSCAPFLGGGLSGLKLGILIRTHRSRLTIYMTRDG